MPHDDEIAFIPKSGSHKAPMNYFARILPRAVVALFFMGISFHVLLRLRIR
jgi:hypothetical protein